MTRALFDRFPEIRARVPWRPLGKLPTPVEPAPALGRHVWVKRDDCSGEPYGGNKVRKLEYVLADALDRGRSSVITIGASASNHVLATSIYAHTLGLGRTHAVLVPQPPAADDAIKQRLILELGVGHRGVTTPPLVPLAVLQRIGAVLLEGGVPYFVGPGASSPLGTLGYVCAGLELAQQIAQGEAPRFDAVYLPLGSGGTTAGLLLGLRLAGLRTRVRAVRVVPATWVTVRGVLGLARRTAELLRSLGARLPSGVERFERGDFDEVRDYVGNGYAHATSAARVAVASAADAGIELETTYSGKACAALLAHARAGDHRGRDVLFWNTFCPAPSSVAVMYASSEAYGVPLPE